MNRRMPLVAALAAALVISSQPATATPSAAAPSAESPGTASAEQLTWQVTSTTPPPVPSTSRGSRLNPQQRVRVPGQTLAQRRAAEADFKTECLNNNTSRTVGGWARSRFEQCFIGHRDVVLLSRRSDGTVVQVAKIIFDYSILAFPVDGSRRVDYVFDFDDFKTEGGEPLPVTTLTVEFTGCSTLVICSATPTQRAELVPVWKTGSNRRYEFYITSPDDTGEGTFSIVRALMTMNMSVVSAAPNIVPWLEPGMAASRTRFDSARNKLGQGKFHGAIFSDFTPTLELDKRPGVDYAEEARHVDDALHNPIRTFPSIPNKSVPGEAGRGRPLHRLMSDTLPDKNNAASQTICRGVWGDEYTSNGTKQCDEYPFKSTHEGSAVSTGATEQNPNGGQPWRWQGSARPIGKNANERGGLHLGLFYGQNRVLDENMGTDRQGTPSDPFYVRIIS